MIEATNVPIMQKAARIIYDISEDTKIREIARLREKALHDEASALKNAKAEGREEGRAEGIAEGIEKGRAEGIKEGRAEAIAEERAEAVRKMKALGFTDEQIKSLYPDLV